MLLQPPLAEMNHNVLGTRDSLPPLLPEQVLRRPHRDLIASSSRLRVPPYCYSSV